MARFFLLGAVALALVACDSGDPVPATCVNESIEIAIDTLALGSCCATAAPNDRVRITYSGTLADGTEFDSGEGVVFDLSRTISGFREGVTGMRIGGRREISIPPYRGYGVTPQDDGEGNVIIPSCSDLVFEVELLDILS